MERITEGNLRATCAAGFVLGALFSWGIFYEYRCAPGIKPLDASAWAQVLVAAVVGAAAVYVPTRIANSEKRRRSEIFVTLLSNVLQPSSSLTKCLCSRRPDFALIEGLLRDIELQGKALESYPIGDIPSAKLLLQSTDAKSHYQGLVELANRMLPAIRQFGRLFDNQVTAVQVYGNAIDQLAIEVEKERQV